MLRDIWSGVKRKNKISREWKIGDLFLRFGTGQQKDKEQKWRKVAENSTVFLLIIAVSCRKKVLKSNDWKTIFVDTKMFERPLWTAISRGYFEQPSALHVVVTPYCSETVRKQFVRTRFRWANRTGRNLGNAICRDLYKDLAAYKQIVYESLNLCWSRIYPDEQANMRLQLEMMNTTFEKEFRPFSRPAIWRVSIDSFVKRPSRPI